MAKTLELVFNAEMGEVKITVRNPKESLTPQEIKAAMDDMVASSVFATGKGRLISPKVARFIDRTIEEVQLP